MLLMEPCCCMFQNPMQQLLTLAQSPVGPLAVLSCLIVLGVEGWAVQAPNWAVNLGCARTLGWSHGLIFPDTLTANKTNAHSLCHASHA